MIKKKEAFITYLLCFDDFLHTSPELLFMHFLDADFGLQVNGAFENPCGHLDT